MYCLRRKRVIVIGSWFKFLFVCAGVGILGYVLVLILLFNKDERKKVASNGFEKKVKMIYVFIVLSKQEEIKQ